MSNTKLFRTCLLLFLLVSLVLPNSSYGRAKEKTIIWSNTTGHSHDGGTKGKKIDAGNVINTPSGDIVATDVQAAVTELDVEKIPETDKAAAGGVATLDGSAKILALQLPAIAITDVSVCASQICQLALVVEEGDVCIRSDENKSYIHNGGIIGDMTDWNVLLSTGIVTSVQSQTGDLTFDHDDWGNMTTDNHHAKSHAHDGIDGSGTTAHSDTTGRTVDDHHDDLSGGYNITPATVTTTGDIHVNSDSVNDKIELGTTNDVNLYRSVANQLATDDDFSVGGGDLYIGADTVISRASANVLTTSDIFTVTGTSYFNRIATASTNSGYTSSVVADSFDRFTIDVSGNHGWGDGTGATDTTLYRSAANTLKTDDAFVVVSTFQAQDVVSLDPSDLGKKLQWGSVGDTTLYRSAASTLKTDDNMVIALTLQVQGVVSLDPSDAGTKLQWGSVGDTNLYRSAANTLKTDDNFTAASIASTGAASTITHTTETKIYTYGAAHFRPHESVDQPAAHFDGNYDSYIIPAVAGSTYYYAVCGINLPDGGTVTVVTSFGSTADAGDDVSFYLMRTLLTGSAVGTMASATFSAGGTSAADSSITDAVINNNSYSYKLVAFLRADDTVQDSQFYNIGVTVTTTDMSMSQ